MTKTFKFYGVDGNCYKLDDTIWEAIEDPNDGYRSYLASIQSKSNNANLIFFSDPIATVEVRETIIEHGFDGYNFVDVVDGHVWLEIGTENYDDYYPCFRFVYHPKEPANIAPKSDGSVKSDWELFISE